MKRLFHRLSQKKHNFSTKLILILVATNLIISSITGLITYRVHQSLFNEELSRQHSMHNQQVLARLDSRIKDMYRITDYITLNPMVKELISEQEANTDSYSRLLLENELEKQLRQVRLDAPEIVAIRIYDMKNNQFNLGSFAGSFQHLDPTFLADTIKQVEHTSGEYIWRKISEDQFINYSYKNWILAARLMKSEDLDTYGVMFILFSTSLFETYLKDLRQQGTTISYLYDHDDQLIYISDGSNEITNHTLPSFSGNENLIIDEQNESYLYTKQKSDKVQFTLINKASLAEVQHRSQLILKVSIISAITSMIFSWLIIMIVSKQLLRPLKKLVYGMTQVKAGKFDTRVSIPSRDELGFIGDRFNQMTEQIDTLIREVYQREINQRDAELKAIQAQLNPHFMYNTLGMFFWKFYVLGDEKSAQLVNSLSEMLQYSLGEPRQLSTLEAEMKQIEHYLNIQKARYHNVLTTEIVCSEEILRCQIIRLLIQPIVENAFVHAFKNKKTDRHLSIHVHLVEEQQSDRPYIAIHIVDNGCGMESSLIERILSHSKLPNTEGNTRESIGLKSVLRRIELVHGAPYGMEILSAINKGTTIKLKLPHYLEGEE